MITISLDQLWGWLIPMAEILCLWFVYYRLLSVIQRTRAEQLLISLSFLLVFFFLTSLLRLERLNYLLTKLFTLSVIAVLVIFQPELRRALAKIVEGRRWWRGALQEEQVMEEVVNAVMELAKRRVGALIALERKVVLQPYVESGVLLDSHVSAELLRTLFMPNAPLHDGGVVIQAGKVAAAGCLFPLSQSPALSKSLGTRHRAAIGLTEETDALVVVVSEETGAVSVSFGGKLTRDLDEVALSRLLHSFAQTESVTAVFDEVAP